MLSMDEARARVARGAAHLDAVRPGWANRIDVGTLMLHDPCGCIVGQLVATRCYPVGLRVLGIGDSWRTGFDLGGETYPVEIDDISAAVLADFHILQDAWIEAIAARVVPADVPQVEHVTA